MKLCRVKDNNLRKKEEFSDIPELVKTISDKTLDELEKEGVFVFPAKLREAKDLSQDQMILQSINDSYCTGNVMGFLGYGEERLVISSRFSNGENDFLLWYMLGQVLELPNIINLETDAAWTNKIISLLIFLFPYYLSLAMRKGVFKTYVRNHHNDGNVRGKIEIDSHIRKNIPFVGNIAYSQREYAYDNYLMQIIRHTVEFIKRKSFGNSILTKVKDEVQQVLAVTPSYEPQNLRKVLFENKKNTVRHAYYYEYRALQQLCILILQGENVQVGFGTKKIYGILFDGAWLWEEYINKLVGKDFHHPMNKIGIKAQKLFSDRSNKKTGEIYPDFIGKNPLNRIIADAKYKPAENVGNKDYLQVLAYMFRFDSKRGYYFYPETKDSEDEELWLNRGTTYEKNVEKREDICLIKHGLKIPADAYDYAEFVEKIQKSEKEFIKPFE